MTEHADRDELRALAEQLPWDSAERESLEVALVTLPDAEVIRVTNQLRGFLMTGLAEIRAARLAALREYSEQKRSVAMQNMSVRIRVPSELNHPRDLKIAGVWLHAQLSPFDFPVAAKVDFYPATRTCLLSFSYPDGDEELDDIAHDPTDAYSHLTTTLYVGQKSGRLFRILLESITDSERFAPRAIEAVNTLRRSLSEGDPSWTCRQAHDSTLGQLSAGERRWPAMQQLNLRVIRDILKLELWKELGKS